MHLLFILFYTCSQLIHKVISYLRNHVHHIVKHGTTKCIHTNEPAFTVIFPYMIIQILFLQRIAHTILNGNRLAINTITHEGEVLVRSTCVKKIKIIRLLLMRVNYNYAINIKIYIIISLTLFLYYSECV